MTRRRNSAAGRVKAAPMKEPFINDDQEEEAKTSLALPQSPTPNQSHTPINQRTNDEQDETKEPSSSINSIPLASCFRGTLTTYTTETHQLIPLAEIRLYQTQIPSAAESSGPSSQLCTSCWSDQEQESKISEDEKVKANSWRGWNAAHPRPTTASADSNPNTTSTVVASSHKSKSKSKSKARKKSPIATPSSASTSATLSSSTAFASHHICIFGEMDVNELTASTALMDAPTYWCQSSGFELTALPTNSSFSASNDKMDERSLGNHLFIHFLQKLLTTRRVALVHFGGDSNECGLLFPISFNIGCIKLISFTAAVGEQSPLAQQLSLVFKSHQDHLSQLSSDAPFLLPLFQHEVSPAPVPHVLSTPSKPTSSSTPPRSSRHTRTTSPSPAPTTAIPVAAVTPARRRGEFGSKTYHQGSGDKYGSSKRLSAAALSVTALGSSPPPSKKRSRAVESEDEEDDIFATTTSPVEITASSPAAIPSGPNVFGIDGVEVLQSYPNMIGLLPPPTEQRLDPFEIYQVLLGPSSNVDEDVEMKDHAMEETKQVDPNDVAPMDIEIDETQTIAVEEAIPPPAAAAPPVVMATLTAILMSVDKEYHTYLTKSEFEQQHMYDFFHHLTLRVDQVWTNEHASWLQDEQPELLINIPNQPNPLSLHLESDVNSTAFLARHLLHLLKKPFAAKDYLEMKDKSGKVLPGKDKVSQEKLKMRFLTLQLHLLLLYAFPAIIPVDGPNPALQSLQTEATNLLKKLPISVARPDYINNVLLLDDYKPPASTLHGWRYQDSVQFLFEQCRDFDCPEGKNRPYKFLLDWRHACLVGGDGSTSAANTTFTQQQHTITSQSTYRAASKSQSSRSQLPSVAARSNTTTSSQPQLVVGGEPSEAPAAAAVNPEPSQNGFLRFLHKKTLAEKVETTQATTTAVGPTPSIAAATTTSSLNQPTLIRTQTISVAATNRPSALPQPGLVQSSLVLPRGRLCSSMSSRMRLIQVTAINKIPSRKAKETKTTAATASSNPTQPPASKPPQASRRPGSGRGKKRRSGGSGSSKKKRPGVKTSPVATTAAAAHAASLLLSPPRSNGHEIVIEETPAKPDRQPAASPQVNSTDHPDHPKNLDTRRVFAADERTALSMVAEGKPSQEEEGDAGHESDSPRPKKKTRRALKFDSPPPVVNTNTFELTSPLPISFTSPIRTSVSIRPLIDSGSSYVLHGTPSSSTSSAVTPSRPPISAAEWTHTTSDSNPRRSTRSLIPQPDSTEASRVLGGNVSVRSTKKEKVAAIKEKPEKKNSKKGRN